MGFISDKVLFKVRNDTLHINKHLQSLDRCCIDTVTVIYPSIPVVKPTFHLLLLLSQFPGNKDGKPTWSLAHRGDN